MHHPGRSHQPPSVSAAALSGRHGWTVGTGSGSPVTAIDAHGIELGATRIASRTLLWAAGVAASPLGRQLGVPGAAFRYRDFGNLATIGRMAAVVEFGRLRLSGLLAWWFWLIAHIFFLIGFRNRLSVLINWAWSYWTYQRGARIITGDSVDPRQ